MADDAGGVAIRAAICGGRLGESVRGGMDGARSVGIVAGLEGEGVEGWTIC